MAKGKGKKFKRKGKNVYQPSGGIKKKVPRPTDNIVPAPAPLANPAEASASTTVSNRNGHVSGGKEKEKEKLYGFIFMCSSTTKSECYQYRVFGLPMGKLDVVEKIKPGAKLFLFDFELKLLYGVYEATSAGELNLEPDAFRGKFPVQVKFRIFKECLPLPESSLRHIIKENYKGSKFNQELSGKQVSHLSSAFRPLNTSSQLAPRSQSNLALSKAIPRSVTEDQFKRTSTLLAVEDPYLARLPYGHAPPLSQPRIVPKVLFPQHEDQRTASYYDHLQPTSARQGLQVACNYYVTDARRSYFSEDMAHRIQDPYSRYVTVQETIQHVQGGGISLDQATSLGREQLQLPIQRQVPYQGSAAAPYVPAVMQPQVRVHSSLASNYSYAGASWMSQ